MWKIQARIRAEWLIHRPLRKVEDTNKMAGAGYKPAPASLKKQTKQIVEKDN
jgi:hypothetical protein